MTILYDPTFPPGMTIHGKWNRGQYQIERLLGEGANGKVYLVKRGKAFFAMKLGYDALDLQMEANVLQSLQKKARPQDRFLIEVDNFVYDGKEYPFYVMKYVKGRSVTEYVARRGSEWIYPVGSGILRKLSKLHGLGWVFGDLKAENVLVAGYAEVELIDYGGVTQIGRAVKQFTEVYDRGYWGAGSRTADPAYDLFSFCILLLQLTDPQKRISLSPNILPQNRNVDYLAELVRTTPKCKPVAPFLMKALRGKYRTSKEAEAEWKQCVHRIGTTPSGPVQLPWLKGFFVASVLVLAAVIFITHI